MKQINKVCAINERKQGKRHRTKWVMRNEMRKTQTEGDKPKNRGSEEEKNEGRCTESTENEGIKEGMKGIIQEGNKQDGNTPRTLRMK